METLYLVDGTGYIFRAYHAIRPMRNAAGTPIHAVLGFTRMLLKLVKEHHPSSMAVVFDAGGRTFRFDIYDEYKAHRQEPPADLKPQFPLCFESVDSLGIRRIMAEGVEADDVLAALARRAEAAGMRTVIVTGDKDLLQLVRPSVQVLKFNPRAETEELLDEAAVRERYGISPAQMVDMLALMGDTSDNVPGVDGVGEKTALELVSLHGSVEGVLAAAPSMKAGKRRDTLIAQSDRALLSKRLVTLHADVPVDVELAALRFEKVKVPSARAFFARLNLRSLLSDPMFAVDGAAAADEAATTPVVSAAPSAGGESPPQGTLFQLTGLDRSRYRVVQSAAQLLDVLADCRKAPAVGLVTFAVGADPMRSRLVGLALSFDAGAAAWLPVGNGGLSLDELRTHLSPLLRSTAPRLVAHDAKRHAKVLIQHAFPAPAFAGDPMLASYVLGRSEVHGLVDICRRELKVDLTSEETLRGKGKSAIAFDDVPREALARYAGEHADGALQSALVLEKKLTDEGLNKVYLDLELPLSEVLTRMECTGVLVEAKTLQALSVEMRADCARLEGEAHAAAGAPFNLASPKQLSEILFGKLGLPVLRKTKTGPSTDMDVLEELSNLHPLPAKVLEHRQLSKLVGTYLEALPELINPRTGRIHTTYQQAVAATGRLSSQDPNLQNIPIRDERGRKIRRAFVAPPGRVLISADYSQIELRILAHVSRDPVLVAAFNAGEDVHQRTASEVFGVPLAEVTRDMRRDAKTINFGLLYGMSAFGLSQNLKIPRAQAKQYLEAYYSRLGGVSAWQQKTLESARQQGLVTTMFGRRRFVPEINERNSVARQAAERIAINSPIQGAAADIIKRAMVRLDRSLSEARLPAQMILQVHDELVIEADESAREDVARHVVEAMEGAADLDVKLVVDVGSGIDWGLAHGT